MSSTQAVGTKPVVAEPAEAPSDGAPLEQGMAHESEVEGPAGDVAGGYTGAADPNLEMLALEVLARQQLGKASEVSIEQGHERKQKAVENVRELEDKIEKAQEEAKKWGNVATAFQVGAIVAGGVATVATAGSAAPVVLFALGASLKMTAMFGDELGIKDEKLKMGLDIAGSLAAGGATVWTSAVSTGASTAATAASTAAEMTQGGLTVGQGGATIAQTQYEGDVHEGHADTTAENNRAENADLAVGDGFEQLKTQQKGWGQSVRSRADEAQRAHESDVRIIQTILGA